MVIEELGFIEGRLLSVIPIFSCFFEQYREIHKIYKKILEINSLAFELRDNGI